MKDPHMYRGEVMNKTGYEVLKMIQEVKAHGIMDIMMPVLVLHGADDEIALSKGSQELFDKAPSSVKKLHILPVCCAVYVNLCNIYLTYLEFKT